MRVAPAGVQRRQASACKQSATVMLDFHTERRRVAPAGVQRRQASACKQSATVMLDFHTERR